MNVRLDDRRIDAQLAAVLQAERDRGLDDGVVEGPDRGGRQPAEGAVKASCLGTGWPSKVVKRRNV